MRLAEGEATVGELAEPFEISLPAISRHLRVLEEADLISREREGQHRRCRLKQEALTNANEWLISIAGSGAALDRFDDHLKPTLETKNHEHDDRRPRSRSQTPVGCDA